MNWAELYRCLFDAGMAVWFFRPVRSVRLRSRGQIAACFLLLLIPAPIYVLPGTDSLPLLLARFAIRVLPYALWLYCSKGTSPRRSLYLALLCWITFTTENNIFLTPQLSFLRWNQVSYTGQPGLDIVLGRLVELALEFAIVTLMSRTLPLWDDRPVNPDRFWIAGAVILCQLYVKSTLKTISGALPETYLKELTVYPILLQILLSSALVLLERYLSGRARQEQERLNELASQYRYENILAREAAAEDIRVLHHDLKNHLLSLQRLAGDNEKLEDYIHQMLQRTQEYEALVETGCPLLNGLLSEKIRQAAQQGIDLNACIDFRPGLFLSDMDICTLFGNALDNAIEASLRVQDPDKRSILVKCSSTAGSLVLTFLNYYEGRLRRGSQGLLSSKAAPGHGVGLASMQRTVEKYGGAMSIRTDEYHNFVLTLLIPFPDEPAAPDPAG